MNKTKISLPLIVLNSFALALYMLLCSFTTVTDTAKSNFRIKTVVIDAGHGGKDPGAHGAHSLEKNVALSIAKKLRVALQSQVSGINVIMTRTDDTFIPLDERSAIANRHDGNLFISIHCNSSPAGSAKQKGAMLLVYGFHRVKEQLEAIRENSSIYQEKDYKVKYQSYDENDPVNRILINAYMQKYRKQSILFGDLLSQQFKNDGRQSIGVKEQGVLVLAHSAMPAVLIETGFINNPVEEDYLTSDAGQDEIVQSIISAVRELRIETAIK
jgi:N-acetylmuramoyl-L-alanine amidase